MIGKQTTWLTTAGLASALVCLGGCPLGGRLGNQGGGTLVSAALKVVTQRMTTITPDEIQQVTDFVSDVSPDIDIVVDDDQAQAAVDFLKANDLNGLEDIQRVADQAQTNPGSIEIPPSLQAIIDSGVNFDDIVSQG